MKKIITCILTICFSLFTVITPINAQGNNLPQALEVQVSFSEEDFVDELIKQGFHVEKVGEINTRSSTNVTNYKISYRLDIKGPNGVTNIPGNHYIFADYKTTAGWKYFVKVYSGGIELDNSSYTFDNQGSGWNYTYGGQGIEWYNTGQFSFASSTSISVSSPWVFGFSTGTTKYYRTEAQLIKNSFHFPLLG